VGIGQGMRGLLLGADEEGLEALASPTRV